MAGRLTYKNENGTWGLINGDIKKVPRELYGVVCKLKDYEESGLTPNECSELRERTAPLPPYPITNRPPYDTEYTYACPTCGNEDVDEEEGWCGKCGQRIDWAAKPTLHRKG